MDNLQNIRPIVIKRKKNVIDAGHHGGAWKVAYADFVTAMMAFFMMMWLLNATTEQQRKGIADYFSPTIPITRVSGGGDGSFGGDSVFSELTAAQQGTGATALRATEGRQALGSDGSNHQSEREDAALRDFETSVLEALGGESAHSNDLLQHVQTRLTDEGLVIEIFEREGFPLFLGDSGKAADWLVEVVGIISDLLKTVRNEVAISAHVASEPLVRNGPSPWDRSLFYAQATRSLLLASELSSSRIARVTGHGDHAPVVQDPMVVRNNRVIVTLLRDGL
jgi:chemotaxis protein MotB